MATMTTVYRAAVMVATGVIVVKGWQLYGPSTEQVKTFAASALAKAQAALDPAGQKPESQAGIADPRTLSPQLAAPSAIPAAPALSTNLNPQPEIGPIGADTAAPIATGPGQRSSAAEPSAVEQPAADTAINGVSPLLARLEELGGADAQVSEWGSGGELFRCCCRAKMGTDSPLARHFEAIASEPALAVEQVVAKVEAWRTQQQSALR
jgi:hypothetical protein